jgi:integrase
LAVDALREHRTRQDGQRAALGAVWRAHDLVFPNLEGGAMNKHNVLFRSFKPLLQRAGLPAIRFHDLRHTAASLMLWQGIHPKVVSEVLGHASVAITLDLYSHVLPHMQREAVDRMNTLLGE